MQRGWKSHSEGQAMTELEMRQEMEIARLQKKIKDLTEAYAKATEELEALKGEKQPTRQKGRPGVDGKARARVLALCRQGKTIRAISREVGLASGTVHKIIAEASRASRVLYVFMDREMPATIIDACGVTQKVKIINLTDRMTSRAFGVREKPDWEDYQEFLESRCMPRTRYGIREELRNLGVDSYDPFQIVEKTEGRVYGDGQWLKRMSKEWGFKLDAVLEKTRGKTEEERRRCLLELLEHSGGQELYGGTDE